MDLSVVTAKLKGNCKEQEATQIMGYLSSLLQAFAFSSESVMNLSVYVVLKHKGGFKAFNTINDKIVEDKLDNSYSDSRELICLSAWNIRKIYRITFISSKVAMKEVELRELQKILLTSVRPKQLRYVIGVDPNNSEAHPISLNFITSMYSGLTYSQLRDCLLSAYKTSLKTTGNLDLYREDVNFHVVSYS